MRLFYTLIVFVVFTSCAFFKEKTEYNYLLATEDSSAINIATVKPVLEKRLTNVASDISIEPEGKNIRVTFKSAESNGVIEQLITVKGEFSLHEMYDNYKVIDWLEEADKKLALMKKDPSVSDYKLNEPAPVDTHTFFEEDPLLRTIELNISSDGRLVPGPLANVRYENIARANYYLSVPDVKQLFPNDLVFLLSWRPPVSDLNYYSLFAVSKTNSMSGNMIEKASYTKSNQGYDDYLIGFDFKERYVGDWAKMTGKNIGKCVAIVMDGKVYSAPMVNQEITGGKCQISGNIAQADAMVLSYILPVEPLPAPLKIINR